MSTKAVTPVDDPISTRRAYIEVVAVYLAFYGGGIIAAAISVGGHVRDNSNIGWADIAPAAFERLAQAGIALALVILLSQRRKRSIADLGLAVRGRLSASKWIRVAAWATLSLIVGSVATSALASANFPFGPNNGAYTTYGIFASINAGVVEETVVLAFVVVTLSQARRSWPEIFIVALLLRVAYHIYYGPGALGILIWAAMFLWLFKRTHSIVPLIAVHIGWDLIGFLSRPWHAVAGVAGLLMLALFVTAPILWLVERSAKKNGPGRPAVRPPPGWYPDPAHPAQMRWWDGWNWTGYAVVPHGGPPAPGPPVPPVPPGPPGPPGPPSPTTRPPGPPYGPPTGPPFGPPDGDRSRPDQPSMPSGPRY